MFELDDSTACLNKLTLKFINSNCGCLTQCKGYIYADALYKSIVLLLADSKQEEAFELHKRLLKLCDECKNC